MRVSVVGSDGYIGRSLCRRLEVHEHTVQRIDARVYGQALHPSTVRAFRPDEIEAVLGDFGPEVVVWLAAYAHDPVGRIPAPVMLRNNCRRAVAALSQDWRFVAVSSLSVFGSGAYPASKRALEDDLTNNRLWRTHIRVLRFGTLFGAPLPGDEGSFRPHLLLNSMMHDAVVTNHIAVRASAHRPVIALRVAVQRLVEAVEDSGPAGTITNCFATSGTLVQFARLVQTFVPSAEITESASQDPRNYGWGPFHPETLRADLRELYVFCTRHRELQDQFNALYSFVQAQDTP